MLKGNSCNLWNITSTKLYTPNAGAVGMLLHINGNNEIISVCKVLFLADPHCQFLGVGHGMQQT
jgi:hypothetical protein